MLALAVYSGLFVSADLDRLRQQVRGPINQLPERDPLRLRFESLHRTSTTLVAIDIGLGLVLLSWYARE